MKTFNLPDLGEGLQEAEIVDWHVSPGDQVVADQPLVSVETDKAVVEVPSPRSGRIGELFGAAGDIVKVGAPLVTFQDAAATDAGTVVGDSGPEQRAEEATAAERAGAAAGVKATPAVRALARRKGVDLALVSPRAQRRDHRGRRRARGGGSRRGGTARAVARRAARHGHAHGPCPRRGGPATVSDDADLDAWTDGDVTIRIVRAIVAGCAAEPALNAWYDSQQQGAPPPSEDRSRHRGRHRGRPVRPGAARRRQSRARRICAAGSSA